MDDLFEKGTHPLISTAFLGEYELVGQGIENPDGSALSIDTDLFGIPRNTVAPRAGPIENLKTGKNEIIFWPVKAR